MATSHSSGGLNIAKELAAMRQMNARELQAKYAEVFGEATRSRHKEQLIRKIAWRMQANAEGGLSERALRRARELANDADLRVTAPRKPKRSRKGKVKTVARKTTNNGTLLPGTILTRVYKGRELQVTVLTDGFEFEGERYRSLSAIAKMITGSHWSGNRFFGVQKKGGAA